MDVILKRLDDKYADSDKVVDAIISEMRRSKRFKAFNRVH